MRNTTIADAIYKDMDGMMTDNKIEVKPAGRIKKCKLMDNSTSGNRDDATGADSMRTRLFYPTIDRMI